jgi:hypothetical protein
VLILACWRSLVVARVFMVSLARVLESLKDCTSFVIKLWYVHVLHSYTYISSFQLPNTCVIAEMIFSFHCLLDLVISITS